MASQYGTKMWLRRASRNLEFALTLLKEPSKQWDDEMSYLEAAIKSLNIIKAELDEVK